MRRLVFLAVLLLSSKSFTFTPQNRNEYLHRLEEMLEPSSSLLRSMARWHPRLFDRIMR
jgi:hypothetical protein